MPLLSQGQQASLIVMHVHIYMYYNYTVIIAEFSQGKMLVDLPRFEKRLPTKCNTSGHCYLNTAINKFLPPPPANYLPYMCMYMYIELHIVDAK